MPVYDTSYQHYSGPRSLSWQWGIIARVTTQWMLRKKAATRAMFFVIMSILVFAVLLFIAQKMYSTVTGGAATRYDVPIIKFFDQKISVGYLLNRYLGFLVIPIFIAVLSAGVGAVAYERQSGGLVAILARPVRRRDYLVGKAVGVVGLPVGSVALAMVVAYVLIWGYLLTWRGALGGLKALGWILLYLALLSLLLSLSTLAAVAATRAVRTATTYLVLYWLGPLFFGAAIHQARLERWAVWIFPFLQLEALLLSALKLATSPDKGPFAELVQNVSPTAAGVAFSIHVIIMGVLSLRIFRGVR